MDRRRKRKGQRIPDIPVCPLLEIPSRGLGNKNHIVRHEANTLGKIGTVNRLFVQVGTIKKLYIQYISWLDPILNFR